MLQTAHERTLTSMHSCTWQIEDCMRSFHPNAVYGNADHEGPNGSKAGVDANKEVCGSRSSALNEVLKDEHIETTDS